MSLGECHLCELVKELRNSHVWPAFLYDRYTSDHTKGGRFADLSLMRLSNRQYKEEWFCDECEKRFGEAWAGKLFANIDNKPSAVHPYDENLSRFLTSMSWRTLKLFYKDRSNRSIEGQWPAARQWRRYLTGDEVGIKSYTQHAWLLNNNSTGFDKFLGGGVLVQEGIVVSQAGPLLVAALLTPERLTERDALIWRNSKVSRTGGRLVPIQAWYAGNGDVKKQNITIRFAALLGLRQVDTLRRVAAGNWSDSKRPQKGQT